MNYQFLANRTEKEHVHSDVELFYMVNGKLDFQLDGRTYTLQKEDFLIVNVDTLHSYQAKEDILALRIEISYLEACEMLKKNALVFWCNTSIEDNEECDCVRGIVRKIIWEKYQNEGRDEIYVTSLYYQLLHVLANDFLIEREDRRYSDHEHKFDDRKQQIEDYIRNNYSKDLSLNELADMLFLSKAYLSKYIKKQFGMSFVDYVNATRFNSAMNKLLYSDKSVLRIAMDSGFASSSALNKVFKEKYNMTPTEFRKQWRSMEVKSTNSVEEARIIKEQVNKFFEENPQEPVIHEKADKETVVLNAQETRPLINNWSTMINIGTAMDLLNSNMQRQILYLKEALHFQYIRFWDLYAKDMFMVGGPDGERFNYDNLDRILDFLVENGLKPYMELSYKPKTIIRNRKKAHIFSDTYDITKDPRRFSKFIEQLIIHLVNRYTPEEVETWFFELWMTEPDMFIAEERDAMMVENYLEKFTIVSNGIHKYLPRSKVGGGGFSLRFGEEQFRMVLSSWKETTAQPEFISIYNYPYNKDAMVDKNSQSMDENFLLNHINRVHQIMEEEGYTRYPLHVSEWNFSVSNRNVLNDHCMKGAYIVKNTIDCFECADMMGYWVGSDLYGNYFDTNLVLNGGSGLLSKSGIPKPAFYAFSFLNRLGKNLWKKGEHYIISDNDGVNWRILCHNLKSLNYKYSLCMEDEVSIENRDNMFNDSRKNRIHFELPAHADGKYLVRVYSVNSTYGSLQDEWISMHAPEDLHPEEVEYLSRVTTPHMVLQHCDSQNHKLILDVVLEPNEIKFFHIVYQY